MPIKPQQHDLDMPAALVAYVPVLTSAGLYSKAFQFAIRIDSLCESIRIDSFSKKIGLSIH